MGWYGRRVEVSAKTLTTHHGEVFLCAGGSATYIITGLGMFEIIQKRSDLVAKTKKMVREDDLSKQQQQQQQQLRKSNINLPQCSV
jgi:hypothetical protein